MKVLFGIFALSITITNFAKAADCSDVIANFGEVTPHAVYRGAAPGPAGLECLKQMGITRDIDLESFRYWVIQPEREEAYNLDLEFLHFPMFSLPGIFSNLAKPNDSKVDAILDVLAEGATHPVFIHCEKGMDRTGLLIGLHRVINEKATPESAWAEMLDYGYHPHFKALTHYFEKRTGFEY